MQIKSLNYLRRLIGNNFIEISQFFNRNILKDLIEFNTKVAIG